MAKIRLPYVPLPQSAVTQTQLHVSDSLSRLLRGSKIRSGAATSFDTTTDTSKPSAAVNLGLDGSPSGLPPGPPAGVCVPRRSEQSRDLQKRFETSLNKRDVQQAFDLWAGGAQTRTQAQETESTQTEVTQIEAASATTSSTSPATSSATTTAASANTTVFPSPQLPLNATFKLLNLLEATDPDSPLVYKVIKSIVSAPENASVFAPAIFRVFVNYFQKKQYATIIALWTDYVNNGCLVGTRTGDYRKFVSVVAPAFIVEEFESRGSREGAARDLIELLGPEAPVLPADKMEKMVKSMLRKTTKDKEDVETLRALLETLRPKYKLYLDVQKTYSQQKSVLEQVQRAVEMKSAHQLNYWWHVVKKSSRALLTLEHCQAFITAFSALKNSAGAFQVWELMESSSGGAIEPSRECWEALLEAASHVTTAQSQFFQQAWDGMVLAGYSPSPHCFALKFRWLLRNRMFLSADTLFSEILAVPSGQESTDVSTGDLPGLTQEILEAYIPCLLRKMRHEEAEQLVQLLTPRETIDISLNLAKTFLEYYLKHKLVDNMPKWLSKMEQQGLFTTPESFVLLLAYNVLYITEVAPDREIFPVLKQIYSQMEQQGIPLNHETFARLIAETYRVCPQLPAARAVFDSLIRADIVPDADVIMRVLRGECSARGDVLMGQELLHSMISMTSNRQFHNPLFWNYLLRALLKQDKQAEALVSYGKMKAAGVPISAHTYTLMLEGLGEDYYEVKQGILTELQQVKEPKKTYLLTARLKGVIRDMKGQGYGIGGLLRTEAPPRWK
ncbi:hypothetical protein B0I72DRAFT_137353 [Yarrowia lipolytica]|jgi:hypothetical protein|uniref:Pentatricopeptide repeat-containing protein n=1 Tax=Yarrowia lipolytica TaxID=4952 RepID=A0A1D8NAX3_YARLL|nr:hypothetical protein YALI1_C18073g [Yarrowia lipolytica]KAB8282363.1 hypothetical protein BKA91DRAFT_138521 [Yarrowia lipolytica]KAE8171735.1 hypothetical protein BKA90DRAFT_138601 [Yarrowia lipolytica]KAJ8053398.1 hypothetical protein LXG23DRAFT_54987 [Yarrowia lipolytica]QNP96232.1 Hypothetical protein YALI2_B00538g [Yarrowia lipolytica]